MERKVQSQHPGDSHSRNQLHARPSNDIPLVPFPDHNQRNHPNQTLDDIGRQHPLQFLLIGDLHVFQKSRQSLFSQELTKFQEEIHQTKTMWREHYLHREPVVLHLKHLECQRILGVEKLHHHQTEFPGVLREIAKNHY